MLLESFVTRTHTVDHTHPSEPPEMYSLHQGTVQGIQTFGCFVELPGFRSNGLVHITQIRNDKRVELVRRILFVRDYCFLSGNYCVLLGNCYLSGTAACQGLLLVKGLLFVVRDYGLFLSGRITLVRDYYCFVRDYYCFVKNYNCFVRDYHLSRDYFVAQCTIYERSLLTVTPLFLCR
jgi:hypothetical protein